MDHFSVFVVCPVMTEAESDDTKTFADVAADNNAYYEEVTSRGWDGPLEADALEGIMDSGVAREAASSVGQLVKFEDCLEKYSGRDKSKLADDIKSVVVKMNAPHLQPSDIAKRLPETPAAVWGLFTLVTNLPT